ncbi:DUF4785 domain-containing protein [Legionella quinlivanii]|uniref:DUF4785 domain-containing protein n=1 Tax=Legionella quinlivanii TaxID=45073 RepID=UPI002243C058|nr:DUF4785 domain-containing protein [Legionella quinlivanii]MCW8450259.1 DUF4785 family protein [Legionella quinlivanii]
MRAKYSIFLALAASQAMAATFPEQAVHTYPCENCALLPRVALSTHWPFTDARLLKKTSPLREQQTKSYQIKVSFAQLQKGIQLPTKAAGAILRINPVQSKSSALPEIPQLLIQKDKLQYTLKEAAELMAKDEALADTPFPRNGVVMQLSPSLGSGMFSLTAASGNNSPADEFIIHVNDIGSSAYFSVSTDKSSYRYGDVLIATIRTTDYNADRIEGTLFSPGGTQYPLTLKEISEGVYQGKIRLTEEINSLGENWYVEAEECILLGSQELKYQAHTAFSYSLPSAALLEIKPSGRQAFEYSAKLNVAMSSRYALQAVLLATDKQGHKIPVETAQSANWLDAGKTTLTLSFSPDLASRYSGPFYLTAIQVIDYGQIKSVFEYNNPILIS